MYTRSHPYLASIKERFSLNKKGSLKETMHIVLNIEGSRIVYEAGDSVAIQPENGPFSVEEFLKTFQGKKEDMAHSKEGHSYPLPYFLEKKLNLKDVTKPYLQFLEGYIENSLKKEEFYFLLKEENKLSLKAFLEMQTVASFTSYFFPEPLFSYEHVLPFLKPLLPRFYSIASSFLAHPDEIYLTIGMLKYEEKERERVGVCSHFLSYLAPLNEKVVPLYIHPAKNFRLPADREALVIMVGPGTGVAPFRAFLEERTVREDTGKNWLFFGDWNEKTDFLYEEYFTSLENKGLLRISASFSRDQEEKRYVQHNMIDQGKDLFEWLEQGAYFYVCGDASFMAKSVDAALHEIIELHGNCSHEEAKIYVNTLKENKRYCRDVY